MKPHARPRPQPSIFRELRTHWEWEASEGLVNQESSV